MSVEGNVDFRRDISGIGMHVVKNGRSGWPGRHQRRRCEASRWFGFVPVAHCFDNGTMHENDPVGVLVAVFDARVGCSVLPSKATCSFTRRRPPVDAGHWSCSS